MPTINPMCMFECSRHLARRGLLSLARLSRLEDLQQSLHHAIGEHADAPSRSPGQVGDACGHGRAAIVHDDVYSAVVLEVRDAHARAERQSPVRHRERGRIERLAARGLLPRKIVAVV